MHKNNLSFDTLNPKTPLSARWAQMSKQEQLIETKRLEILAKMEAQKKAKLKPSEANKPDLAAMNKFSNDGSFMNQFKKLSDDLKRGKKPDRDLKQPPDEEKNQQAEGDRDRRPDRFQSSSGSRHHNRERSRSPNRDRKRNIYKWEASDRQDNRDGKHRRWDSGGHSHHRTSSPSTPIVEDSPRRNPPVPFPPHPNQGAQQPYFDNFNMQGNNPINPPPMFPPNSMIPPNLMFQNSSMGPNFMPNMNIPPSQAGPDFNNFKQQVQNNQISFANLPPHANSLSQQSYNQGNQNQFNLNKHNNFPPAFGVHTRPPGNLSNIMPPNNFNQQSYGPRNFSPPADNGNVQMKLISQQTFSPMLFPNIPTPQGVPNVKSTPNANTAPQPVNAPKLNPVPGLNVAPPISIPLHTIPEPKPLDTLSIPPPKPLDAVSIPPPKPLDAVKIPPPAPLEAVKIPPPKPMNLQTIPPPSPICLTQIPKPKELDVCSIPPPPTSSVLSSDDRRWSALEAVAAQVARTGDDLEDMLKTQCQQDPSIWFLRDEHCADYQIYRDLVSRYRKKLFSLHGNDVKKEEKSCRKETAEDIYVPEDKYVPEEEKYEPEFCLDYESSEDETKREFKTEIKQEVVQNVVKSEPQISDNGGVKVKSGSGTDSDGEGETKIQKRERKRKSRWGDGPSSVGLPGIAAVQSLGGIVTVPAVPPPVPATVLAITGEKAQLTKITRQEPGLLQYALNSYGTSNLTEEDWKKCEDHYKISLLYQEMLKKRRELECLAASGRHKYEYDSDEEVEEEGGTWEHRLRQQEMEATSRWAGELTRAASGKHHIGDFLPPEELKRFMDKYSAVKGGQEPDLSDYKEYKLKEDNIGFKMLQKLGWSEGEGLGADGSGIVNPVNKGTNRESNQGLGVDRGDNLEEGDDEFDAYRKRMMLAYRFRPNPLNNPRRPYY